MRNVIAALAFLALVTSCGGGAVAVPTATSATAVETTSSTAFKLPPVGDTPEEVEAEFVRFLREWSAEQPEATTIDGTTDQVLVDTGRELCEAVAKVEAATEGGHILGFYLFMGEELEAQGFNTDSFEAIFFRSMFIDGTPVVGPLVMGVGAGCSGSIGQRTRRG